MKLCRLTTKNFKKLGNAEFDFTTGVNFIVGPNGAGKSTVLRAISVALFGVSALPGVAADVATWGSNSWGLLLAFEHAGNKYTIQRDHRTAKVLCNDELVANGNRPSVQYIEDLLGRTQKDFNLLSNSRQGETTYALNYGAAALQREVERLSGADSIERVIGAAKAMKVKLDAEVTAASEMMLSDDDVHSLEAQVEQVTQEITTAREQAKEQDVVLAVPPPAKPKQDLGVLRKMREAWVTYEAESKHHMSTLAQLRKQLEAMGDAEPEDRQGLERLAHVYEGLQAEKGKWEKASSTAASLTSQIKEIKDADPTLPEQVAKAEAEQEAAESAWKKLGNELALQKAEVTHLTKHLKDGVCPTCGTVLKDDVEEVKAKLVAARAVAAEQEQAYEKAASVLRGLRKATVALRGQRAQESSEQAQKAKLEERLQRVDFGSWDPKAGSAALAVAQEAVYTAQNRLRDAKRHNEERSKLASAICSSVAPEPVAAVLEADVCAVEAEWEVYRAAQIEWNVQHATAEEVKGKLLSQASDKERFLKDTASRLAVHRRMADSVSVKGAKSALCGRLTEFLRDRRAFYLTRVWDAVLGAATRFLSTTTEGWLSGMSIKDGTFLFEEGSTAWIPAVEASGAQAAFLGVALRVGLSRALDHDRSLMILDEPTESMTEDNARRLMAGVGAARDQVLVVTHRSTDQGLADTIISVGS